ncbi:pheromone autoinducer 2 transporter [Roseovarius albus]|uniref:Pheromone autoinducer 2 transporter n=1 Tax=Roseovarius albus TaxID=1247867 RepID=A0A1X6ZJY4_9RHOB|nr:AI-2E family transporter [Roseovarius albus]SLN51635.1 pheromone autoinducer 2 transporter [Roseovarius albus]
MALSAKTQLKAWGVTAAVFLLLMWLLGDVMLPFVLGAGIAYMLDPIADRFEAMGCSRSLSVGIITLLSIVVFVAAILMFIPALIEQAIALFHAAPEAFQQLHTFISERLPQLDDRNSALREVLDSIGATLKEKGPEFVDALLGSAASIVNVIILLVIAPVVAVYLLYDWDRMIAKIDDMLPRDHVAIIRQLAKEIDSTLASFVRGMGTVCLILGTYYSIALVLVGLQFGLLVGAVAGLVTFIPYLGALIGGSLAIGLALFQFWGDWFMVALVAGIFMIGQMMEGNFLTPKLVGSSVGLHPVWLIFALSVFGALFGFVGMLIAVPLAAAIGVIARFAIGQYKTSLLYIGLDGQGSD